jgi:hypothetical protein
MLDRFKSMLQYDAQNVDTDDDDDDDDVEQRGSLASIASEVDDESTRRRKSATHRVNPLLLVSSADEVQSTIDTQVSYNKRRPAQLPPN